MATSDANEALAAALVVTQERTEMLDMMGKRLTVNHSLTLHRDSASASDVRAMITALTAARIPDDARLKVDHCTERHTGCREVDSMPEVSR